MSLVNIHEAKTQLSQLIERVRAGEEVVIAKAGRPVVRLVPYLPPQASIAPPGGMEGEGWIAEDFDASIDDLFECLHSPR